MDFIGTENLDEMPSMPATSETSNSPIIPVDQGPIFSFYLIFKALPLGVYLFGWLLFGSMMQWVSIIILSAIDFWYTKNVAGRLIVGLLWSNKVNDEGENQWVFEHSPNYGSQSTITAENKGQTRTFWLVLYGAAVIWFIFAFFSFIRLKPGWLMCTGIACTLALVNAWGFNKCDGDSKKYLKNTLKSQFGARISQVGSIFSNFL